MARTRSYQHFCPVARSLELIGEKWSLLVVRDLLRGPQRFSDLLASLGGITPKWLTLRLRELEAAGIVARDARPGRREVWYQLTAAGRDLAPVVEALSVWGVEHAIRPPQLGEAVHPAQTMSGIASVLNRRGRLLERPAVWVIRFAADRAWTLRCDGARWSVQRGAAEPADLAIEATPEAWVTFLLTPPPQRAALLGGLRVSGAAEQLELLVNRFGWWERPARAAAQP
ncbi:MAG TPA: helix-turn-helix domain-containing protein [Dehalococcoidia bacterium]|nr:helix-turn-helix domain-containing protein [Dehalococcoidia bacterium]